jgi:oxygen-independent coproporphyrinogen-3 oxidase
LEAGFQNVCVDLIYGLPAQTVSSWASSVQQCIDLGPQTICCYPLTLRPHTGFGRTLLHGAIGRGSYDLWHRADTLLQEAGYARETHVRWSLPGGGYLQKQLHWGMQNLVGLGAGARSYLWHLDIRYGYSVTRRVEPLRLYLASSEAGEPQAIDGFQMDDDERLRKAVTLGLFQLDRMHVTALTGLDPWVVFAREFTGLVDRGLAYSDEKTFTLTEAGVPYRDLIAQLFFSDRVKELVQTHSYDE